MYVQNRIYFLVSFPMFLRIDEADEDESAQGLTPKTRSTRTTSTLPKTFSVFDTVVESLASVSLSFSVSVWVSVSVSVSAVRLPPAASVRLAPLQCFFHSLSSSSSFTATTTTTTTTTGNGSTANTRHGASVHGTRPSHLYTSPVRTPFPPPPPSTLPLSFALFLDIFSIS